MEKTPTEFPCCLWDGWDNVQLGDDGLPLIITRDNISTWFEWNEIPMPENPDGLSDADLIVKLADPLKAKSCYRIISYPDALHFTSTGALDPAALLRKAIKERDEEIARKKAEEEARAEAERRAEEKEEREQQETYEKLKGFLESIGDFEMHGPSSDDPDGDEAVGWLEKWNARIIPFKECWHDDGDEHGFWIGSRHTETILLHLHIRDGFDDNVKKIIKWMVDNGAREPEPKTEAA